MRRSTPLMASLCLAAPFAIAWPAPAQTAHSQARDRDDDDDDLRSSTTPADIIVSARKLDVARATVEPSLGASVYSLSNEAMEARPAGETTSIAQIMLQVPGVAQSGAGQIAVRGLPGVQYRINNVILPDGIADLGERLSPRLAERVDLLTGALPAQYGLQVGGVVNITTKNGAYGTGGQLELYGGSHGRFQPAFEYAGASGATSYFASGSYTRDAVGLPSPDGGDAPAHDLGQQIEGLAYVEHVINAESRLSLLIGSSDEHFEIPENSSFSQSGTGLAAAANPPGAGRSSTENQYGTLSYLRTDGPTTLQLSLFGRYSTIDLRPGASAGLPITGIGGQRRAHNWSTGVQVEGAYQLDSHQTLRGGVVFSYADLSNRLDALVSPSTGGVPFAIAASSHVHRQAISLFLQDEWRLLDHLTLNLGGRIDHIGSLSSGTRVEPRANLVWSGPAGITLHAGYARYLVAPALFPSDQLRALTGTSVAPNGSADDRSRFETDDYFDIGAEKKVEDLSVGVGLFQRSVDNLLGHLEVGSPLIVRHFMYRAASLRGVEFHVIYREGPLSAWANFTYLYSRARGFSSGQVYLPSAMAANLSQQSVQPEGVQPYTASAGASYKLGALQLSGDMLYGAGSRDAWDSASSPGRLPSYTQVNFAAVYYLTGLGGRPLDARIDVINAFDTRYRLTDSSNVGIPQWGPRRGTFIGLEQSF